MSTVLPPASRPPYGPTDVTAGIVWPPLLSTYVNALPALGALLSPSVSVTTTWTRPAPSVGAFDGRTFAAAGKVAVSDVGKLTWKSEAGST